MLFFSYLEEEGVVTELGVGGLQSSKDPSDNNGCGALDVIVEGAVRVAVLLEEPEGILVAEVLKLDQRVLAIVLDNGLHELINEVVILLARHTPVSAAYVVHVLQTFCMSLDSRNGIKMLDLEILLIVGADIQGDRQCLAGFDSSQCSVEGQLSNRYAHALPFCILTSF